jgi:hypothetical protein
MPSPLVFPYPTYLQSYLPAANALTTLVEQSGSQISWDEMRSVSETLLTAAGPAFPEDRRAVLDFFINTDPVYPAGTVVSREVAETFLAKLRGGGFLPSDRNEHPRLGYARLLGMRGDWGEEDIDRWEEGLREIYQRHPSAMNDGGLRDGLHDLAATFGFFRRLKGERPRVFEEICAFWRSWNAEPGQSAQVALAREEHLPEMPVIDRLSARHETARLIGYLHIVARACLNEEEPLSWTRRQIDRFPELLEDRWFEAAACASIVFAHLQDVFDGGPGNILKRFLRPVSG